MEKENTNDLYGFEGEDIDVARHLVEGGLEIELDAHESLYRGGDYYRQELGNGELTLQANKDLLWQDSDPFEEQWAEPEFAAYAVLLYIEGHSDSDAIKDQLTKRIPQIHFLRREQG